METIQAKGRKLTAEILACKTSDDPQDSEHRLFEIDFAYEIDGVVINKSLKFSINMSHLAYACAGQLHGVPKLDCSPADFEKALGPGETLDLISMDTPPYHFITTFNRKTAEVMDYDQMWM